mmetsp:Transcript_84559/g.244300  ORF Transcript_84559/g.244300 Transcript_84559/m.244300 type:complete len:377 (-) Transcript_84559:78-1208(-)
MPTMVPRLCRISAALCLATVLCDNTLDNGSAIFPFIVVMQMRVGSTWFQSTHMAQHPDVWAQFEICHGATVAQCGDHIRKFIDQCLQQARIDDMRPTWCGFKEFAYHVLPWIDMLHEIDSINSRFRGFRIIHLYRANVVKQAMSIAAADATGRWACKAESVSCQKQKQKGTPKLHATDVMHWIDQTVWKDTKKLCELLRRFPASRVIEISYEDLLTDEATVVRGVYDFLGLQQWTGWKAAKARNSYGGDPFAVLNIGEKEDLRHQLRAAYGWANLEAALDGDTGFETLTRCWHCDRREIMAGQVLPIMPLGDVSIPPQFAPSLTAPYVLYMLGVFLFVLLVAARRCGFGAVRSQRAGGAVVAAAVVGNRESAGCPE